MNKTKLILLFTGIIVIIGCLAGLIAFYSPMFLYGITLGLMVFIYGFYHEDIKIKYSQKFVKKMVYVFILQWLILFCFFTQFSKGKWTIAWLLSFNITIYFLMQVSRSNITIFKVFKEEKTKYPDKNIEYNPESDYKPLFKIFKEEEIIIDPDKNTLYQKGNSLKNLKQYQKALKCYEKALELDPKFKPALEAKNEVLKFL